LGIVTGLGLDKGGVGFAQSERVAMDHHLHRVAKGRIFHDFDAGIGDKAHIKEVLAALAFTSYSLDACGLTYFEFI
jgi:hypothetical protein